MLPLIISLEFPGSVRFLWLFHFHLYWAVLSWKRCVAGSNWRLLCYCHWQRLVNRGPSSIRSAANAFCKNLYKKKRTYIPKRAGSNWNQKELNAAHGLCIGMYTYISIVTCMFLCDFRCVSMCSFASVDMVKSKWSCCRIETLLKNLQSYIICIIKLASVQYTCYSIQFL